MPSKAKETPWRRFVAGSAAGEVTGASLFARLPLTYEFRL